MDLNQFLEWAREDENRYVSIKIGELTGTEEVKIWVYDYQKGVGQLVKSVDEIDLDAEKERVELEHYKRLKEKYGEVLT